MTGRSCEPSWAHLMINHPAKSTSEIPSSSVHSHFCEPHWYAAYTNSNHEKRVGEELTHRSVEHFLPLYGSVRQWKDRKVHVQLPLFPGYVFVRLAICDRMHVLQIPGVAKLVGFSGMPTPLPQGEIESLRLSLLNGVRAEPHPYLRVGHRVRVKSGPFMGLEGILKREKNQNRLVVSLDLLLRSVAVEVSAMELEPA